MGYRGRFTWDASKPNGQPRRAVDASRARAQLGWTARTSLEAGLARTIEWWKSHRE
jgi:GDP-L-fucose synthase